MAVSYKKYEAKERHTHIRGLEFSLPFDVYERLLSSKICAYSGATLKKGEYSLERVDNNKGYVIGNVVPVHIDLNKAKNSFDLEGMKEQIHTLQSRINSRLDILEKEKKQAAELYNKAARNIKDRVYAKSLINSKNKEWQQIGFY